MALVCLNTKSFAQKPKIQYDTLKIAKHTSLILKDVTLRFDKDTVLILPDTVFYKVKSNFYHRLKDRWYQRRFTKQLFDFLFSLPSDDFKLDTTQFVKSENPFLSHQGKTIGNISLIKLEALGTRMDDLDKRPESVVQKLGNTVNFKTRDRVIRNNLLFEPGDTVNAALLADNERILRELPYIRDSRITVIPRPENPDIVDLEILTKDVVSLSFDLEARDFDSGVLRVNHKNIFGSGHEVDNRFAVDNGSEQKFSYQFRYRVPNIKRSFTSLEVRYADTENLDITSLQIKRDFVTPAIKYAGGIEWSQQTLRERRLENIISDLDFDEVFVTQQFDYQDVWLARAFPLRMKDPLLRDRTRLIVSGRLSNIDFLRRPTVLKDQNQAFHNRFQAIGGLGFSQRRYFKDQLIFGYGRTEDIPYGMSLELLAGHEWGEFYDRSYLGARISRGGYIGLLGYFFTGFTVEGFKYNNRTEQGVFRADFRYISNLIDLNQWKFRQFITFNYTKGFNRFDSEFIDIRSRNGIRGLDSHTLRGTQRLLLNIETVSFTPLQLLDFRLAVFGFADIGKINNGERDIFKEKSQTGFGIGFRIRNDNLTFNAVEIRLAYYPDVPIGIDTVDLDLSGSSGFRFNDFFVSQPQVGTFN